MLIKLVARSLPLNLTTEPLTKLPPLIVKVNEAPPTTAVAGATLPSTGCGLLIVRLVGLELPPPGVRLNTKMLAAPAVCMSLAVISAVN